MDTSFYWLWEKAIPPATCDQLLREVGEMNLTDGRIDDADLNAKWRTGKTAFLPSNHWFEGILLNHARWANQSANWGFQVDNCEPLQIASYKTGEKYEWHSDDNILSRNKPYHRKLTVVCQLSRDSDFTGGGLYLEKVGEESLLKAQGDLVVFPSFLDHKAATVESGHRVTVVSWVTGRYFL
jgi:predicted 2-oxoglutarate/Fe(II)-dependent dioxygenase YbiX